MPQQLIDFVAYKLMDPLFYLAWCRMYGVSIFGCDFDAIFEILTSLVAHITETVI